MKATQPAAKSPALWSTPDLGAFYTAHRYELKAHAERILKDSSRADEVVQDAFIKVILAAPELTSEVHALSYLHRTVENLCIDLFRMEGRRPNLVLLDDATAEVEASWQDQADHAQAIAAAEDAAIIRQALAFLSPAERTALVMWEMDGRTTQDIATELGIKESSVRHTVSRARASLRNVLSTLVIDEKRGLTALDALSTTYKKAAELAQKSSKVALSLLLVVAAFLGFNTFTPHKLKIVVQSPTQAPTQSSTPAVVVPISPNPPVAQSLSRQTQIASLQQSIALEEVQLQANVDLLLIANQFNVFGQNPTVNVASLTLPVSTTTESGA